MLKKMVPYLVIQKIGYDGNRIGHPYQIEKYEDFASRPFEELWEYMSTPKYRLDNSARDNPDGSPIKQVSVNTLFPIIHWGLILIGTMPQVGLDSTELSN